MALVSCPGCKKQISEHAEKCPHCSAKFKEICPECGAALPVDTETCSACGYPLAHAGNEHNLEKLGANDGDLSNKKVDVTTENILQQSPGHSPELQYGDFRDPTNLVKWTTRFIYITLGLSVISIFSNIMELQLLTSFENDSFASSGQAAAAADANDIRQGFIGVFYGISLLVTAILSFMWIYRSNCNARALGALKMRFTPAWSVGWYFVPIVGFWKGYQVLKEIWKTSSNPENWATQSVPALLPWYWFTFIVCGLTSNISFRMSFRAETISELKSLNLTTQISDVFLIVSVLMLVSIIKEVHTKQMSHAEKT